MRMLSETALDRLPAGVERPRYARAAVRSGVIHLGIGAFHRAHQAVVFDNVLGRGDLRWGIRGASLRSPAVRDTLAPQSGLYSVVTRDGVSEQVRIVGAVRDVLVAPETPDALVEALAAPDTHIVTLTITEKGYKLDPATGSLLANDADVAADVASLAVPRTAAGLIVAALDLRRARGLAPFTAISCDNLPENGRRLEAAVLALAQAHDPALGDWIARHGAFPQTMVDRIVPATDKSDVEAVSRRLEVVDRAVVKTEPFLQWVIENRFAGERPDFEAAGVQLTANVAPWEEAKLRLLNGAHSAIAYLGGLADIEFVHEFVELPEARRFVEALWDEAETTLSPPPGLDVVAYRRALMQRFRNPALDHRTRQIAMDGSQKLPQRLLATIAHRLERGQGVEALALAVAAWMRWQCGRTDGGARFEIDDPLADRLGRRVQAAGDAAELVDALLAERSVFPAGLAVQPALAARLRHHLDDLAQHGVRATLKRFGAEAHARMQNKSPAIAG